MYSSLIDSLLYQIFHFNNIVLLQKSKYFEDKTVEKLQSLAKKRIIKMRKVVHLIDILI